MPIEIGQVTIGVGSLAGLGYLVKILAAQRKKKPEGTPPITESMADSLRLGIAHIKEGILRLEIATSGIPQMRDDIDVVGSEIASLKQRVRRGEGDIADIRRDIDDIRRENEGRDDTIERLKNRPHT